MQATPASFRVYALYKKKKKQEWNRKREREESNRLTILIVFAMNIDRYAPRLRVVYSAPVF